MKKNIFQQICLSLLIGSTLTTTTLLPMSSPRRSAHAQQKHKKQFAKGHNQKQNQRAKARGREQQEQPTKYQNPEQQPASSDKPRTIRERVRASVVNASACMVRATKPIRQLLQSPTFRKILVFTAGAAALVVAKEKYLPAFYKPKKAPKGKKVPITKEEIEEALRERAQEILGDNNECPVCLDDYDPAIRPAIIICDNGHVQCQDCENGPAGKVDLCHICQGPKREEAIPLLIPAP